ncbi:MAG: dienelactone hydrolase family protein [Burkholderiales bacterium]|nr:dienelactone hydrolase family protein [Burkholderiales bacterium]
MHGGGLRRLLRVGLLAVAGQLAAPLHAQTPPLDRRLGEAVMTVPADGLMDPQLEVTVFKPPGDGPFPVVVINHGRSTGNQRLRPRWRPVWAAAEFVRRGWAVVAPMRQGFAGSGGMEITSRCNVAADGRTQAHSIRRTLDWLATQPWADASRNVVMGQSHGGLATLAYGTQPHLGTRLLVNFAGGLREEFCAGWEQALVSAIAAYGAVVRMPSLWFYGENDSFFPPAIARPAHEGYVRNGGPAQLVAFGPFGDDAHLMFGSRAGLAIWVPPVMAALAAAGLPVDPLTPGDER